MTLALLRLDVRAGLRERKIWFAAAIYVYTLLAVPLLLLNPPPHVAAAMSAFFGDQDPFTFFMYVWTDLAMNKVVAMLGVVLAAGVVLRERDTRVLPIFASKPISMPRYFAVRATSACLVTAVLYITTQLIAVPVFMARVPGFRPGEFLAAGLLHVWAAMFATALAATLTVIVGRRGPGLLLSLIVIMTLVGMAFLGFYNPAWRSVALLNPFALGVEAVGHLGALGPGVLLPPMLGLAAICAVTIMVGAFAVRRLEV